MAQQPSLASLPPASLHLLSGALSGFASCVVLQPFDLLKTRLQQEHITTTPHKPPNNIYRISADLVARDGVLGLWRGTSPTIIRNVPGIAAYFFGLAQLRNTMASLNILTQQQQQHPLLVPTPPATLSPAGDFLAGVLTRSCVGFVLMPITVVKTRFEAAKRVLWEPGQHHPVLLLNAVPATFAAAVATLLTAPFDLIKTDRQLHNHSSNSSLTHFRPANLSNFHILFKGSGLRLLRKSLSSAIGWTLYEGLIKKWTTHTTTTTS
ncbi:hypothetical protein VP01_987g2 [Puccinia sorghi]|uniref:Uncharacterized protein n=1 Tax=Puccinia sorghi TaxID=27349 RepID=A0A0L6U5H4_9BASI|nr:hypothetical protein VP01_987g2 [Puccinia sorghi]